MLKEDWEFNVIGVYNYKKSGPLQYYFDYVKQNVDKIEGELLEAGVYQGRSLLGMALMLKELGSDKKIYGFDTFTGFPPAYHEFDKFENFERLFNEGRITKEHYLKHLKNSEMRQLLITEKVDEKNISLSGNFGNNSLDVLKKKIEYLGLDNVVLVPGPFEETMSNSSAYTNNWLSVMLDCDLYNSYKVCLNFTWDKVSKGGSIYLDEYYSLKFPGARIAVDEFLSDKAEEPLMHDLIVGDFERWSIIKSM
ncbi:MAG: TylF/MycF/NovP-related O-methyltransferase [Gammaproteobacteria bacterium]